MSNRLGKCGKYEERRQSPHFREFELILTASSAYQDARSHPCRDSCLQITQGIANADRSHHVQVMFFSCLEKQARFWFPARAFLIRCMRAHEGIVHPTSCQLNRLENTVMDRFSSFHRYDSPSHHRLIGHYDDFNRCVCQFCQSFQRSRQKQDILPAADIIRPIFNNHSIPVEE